MERQQQILKDKIENEKVRHEESSEGGRRDAQERNSEQECDFNSKAEEFYFKTNPYFNSLIRFDPNAKF